MLKFKSRPTPLEYYLLLTALSAIFGFYFVVFLGMGVSINLLYPVNRNK